MQKTVTINKSRYTAQALASLYWQGQDLNTVDRAVVLPCGTEIALTVRPDRVTIYNWGGFQRKGTYGAPCVNLAHKA